MKKPITQLSLTAPVEEHAALDTLVLFQVSIRTSAGTCRAEGQSSALVVLECEIDERVLRLLYTADQAEAIAGFLPGIAARCNDPARRHATLLTVELERCVHEARVRSAS